MIPVFNDVYLVKDPAVRAEIERVAGKVMAEVAGKDRNGKPLPEWGRSKLPPPRMIDIVCEKCGVHTQKTASVVTRTQRTGNPLTCSQKCYEALRRRAKNEERRQRRRRAKEAE